MEGASVLAPPTSPCLCGSAMCIQDDMPLPDAGHFKGKCVTDSQPSHLPEQALRPPIAKIGPMAAPQHDGLVAPMPAFAAGGPMPAADAPLAIALEYAACEDLPQVGAVAQHYATSACMPHTSRSLNAIDKSPFRAGQRALRACRRRRRSGSTCGGSRRRRGSRRQPSPPPPTATRQLRRPTAALALPTAQRRPRAGRRLWASASATGRASCCMVSSLPAPRLSQALADQPRRLAWYRTRV